MMLLLFLFFLTNEFICFCISRLSFGSITTNADVDVDVGSSCAVVVWDQVVVVVVVGILRIVLVAWIPFKLTFWYECVSS